MDKESGLYMLLLHVNKLIKKYYHKLSKLIYYKNRIIARKMYSSPPIHGALIVDKVLNNK